jgi:hypothetical protein
MPYAHRSHHRPGDKQDEQCIGSALVLHTIHQFWHLSKGESSLQAKPCLLTLYLFGERSLLQHEPSSSALGIMLHCRYLFASKTVALVDLTQSASPNQLVLPWV